MIKILIILPIFWDAVLTWPSLKDVSETSSEICTEGQVIHNSCLECTCTGNNVYDCISKGIPCSKRKGKKHSKKYECDPQVVYVYEETTCMCNKNGRWPHKRCRNVFNIMPSKQFCTPNSYVIEDCNVCRCGPTGKIDREHCTQNDCSVLVQRRSNKLDNVQGSCEPSNWYSLAPCQFCYCVHINKLVCSTGNNKLSKLLELGAYNLTVCGKGMIKEVIELVPEAQRALRDGEILLNSVMVTTEMMTNQYTVSTRKPYTRTPMTMSTKTIRPYTTHKQLQVNEPDESNQRDIVKTVDQIEQTNKDVESESSEEDDTLTVLTSKITKKQTKRPLPSSTNTLYQEDETSEEVVVSSKPKTFEATTSVAIKQDSTSETKKMRNFKIPLSAKVTFENIADSKQTKSKLMNALSNSNTGGVYKINFPSVLDKILSMTLKRRSMVKLNAQSNCVPGQTTKEGCNNCFCLANGKLLCTHKPCNGTTSEP